MAIQKNYNLSVGQVANFAELFLWFYPISTFLYIFYASFLDLRNSIIIGAVFNCVGAILKVFFNQSYWIAFFGQTLIGAIQPLIVNAITKLAAYWFRAESTVTVVAIGNGFNLLGVLLGYIFFNFFLSNKDEGDVFKEGMYNYLFWEAVLVCLFSIPSIIFMENKPPNPPSSLIKKSFAD